MMFLSRFSVDFTAHISYHYLDSEGAPDDRVRNSLYGLGLPILQGAVSTVLGVVGLMIAPSYIFVTFFKMVFLVITLGFLHGLFLLPVLLSIFGPGSCSSKTEKPAHRSPTTSYLSDGESLPSKHELESKQSSQKTSPSLRIPRPTTNFEQDTRSSSTGSQPHVISSSAPATTKQEKGKKRRGRSSSRDPQPPIHEMYHNNGYMSEEDANWGGHWSLPPQQRYMHGYPYPGGPGQFFPSYGYPVDQRLRNQNSKDRKCKSKSDCKRKKQKH